MVQRSGWKHSQFEPVTRVITSKRASKARLRLYRPASLDDAHQHDDDADDQENVDETAERVRRDHSQKPHQKEQYSNGFEHVVPPFGYESSRPAKAIFGGIPAIFAAAGTSQMKSI
jgi:hypothetical protein